MLKQSLVQVKVSDLINEKSDLKLKSLKTSSEILPSHMPQWPRVQLDKQITSNLKRNSKIILNSNSNGPYEPGSSMHTLTNSRYNNKSPKTIKNNSTMANNGNLNDGGKVEFDGDETIDCYSKISHGRNNHGHDGGGDGESSFRSNGNNNNTNIYLNNSNNQSGQNTSNNLGNDASSSEGNNNLKDSGSNDPSAYDLTMKLRYLEKSIKFIQQQHTETLSSLHQEIEKLKSENRELHFKLAVRKNSASNSGGETASRTNLLETERTNSTIVTTKITNLKGGSISSNELKDPVLLKGFDKALKESAQENDLDKRLTRIKTAYDSNKYGELQTRLNDAESKNEYLSKIIAQLKSKSQAVTSDYKLDTNSSNNFENTAPVNSQSNLMKLNLNNIYTIEPLRIKLHEHDEPRPPTLEESEVFISKLYDLYKHQKQQISNMKVVLKDMMLSENLSNQGMMMTKDVLENNSNKISQYLIDNTNGFQKLSIVTPITRFAPQSGLSNRRYHSQFLATLASTNTQFNPIEVAASLQAANAVSNIQLPPLATINPAKFPDRQRRTQVLQKQRLRRDYFH